MTAYAWISSPYFKVAHLLISHFVCIERVFSEYCSDSIPTLSVYYLTDGSVTSQVSLCAAYAQWDLIQWWHSNWVIQLCWAVIQCWHWRETEKPFHLKLKLTCVFSRKAVTKNYPSQSTVTLKDSLSHKRCIKKNSRVYYALIKYALSICQHCSLNDLMCKQVGLRNL